jgi:hypothetical protein
MIALGFAGKNMQCKLDSSFSIICREGRKESI